MVSYMNSGSLCKAILPKTVSYFKTPNIFPCRLNPSFQRNILEILQKAINFYSFSSKATGVSKTELDYETHISKPSNTILLEKNGHIISISIKVLAN